MEDLSLEMRRTIILRNAEKGGRKKIQRNDREKGKLREFMFIHLVSLK